MHYTKALVYNFDSHNQIVCSIAGGFAGSLDLPSQISQETLHAMQRAHLLAPVAVHLHLPLLFRSGSNLTCADISLPS